MRTWTVEMFTSSITSSSGPSRTATRHGTGLSKGIIIQPNEPPLFCNLIRCYISYLMAEHARSSAT
jgi:hypothetical protein